MICTIMTYLVGYQTKKLYIGLFIIYVNIDQNII